MTQSDKILVKLREAGDKGVSNIELNQIAFRYSARINDLRKDGYVISATHAKGSAWKFTLHEEEQTDIFSHLERSYG